MKLFFALLLCTFSLFLGAQQNDSLKFEIKNIGSQVNSYFSDYAPLISADGSTMVFTSRRVPFKSVPSTTAKSIKDLQNSKENKEGNSSIYITYYNEKNETWIEPVLLEPVINLFGVDNSAIALSNDGQRMLLYRGGNNKNINKGIYESVLKGNEWSVPIRLSASINSDGSETSASFSPDGRTIYFVSSRKGGFGGLDIWYSTQDEAGNWGDAVNIGKSINTKEDEESVFIHPNGSTLFFSSKGHNSIGGYDIFVSQIDTATTEWAKAENLGSSINTPGDDLYFVMAANEKTAYYASSKPKGFGDKDIYTIKIGGDIIKKHITLLKGFVIGENGVGIKSKIVIKDKTDGTIINTLTSNKSTGKYLVSLPINKDYKIEVTDDNNGTYSDFIEISDKTAYNEIVKNIVLEPKYATAFSRVVDENGNPISSVQIELIDVITKQLIGKFETNSAGNARFSLPFEKKFSIIFSKFGYFFQSVNISIPKSNGSEPKDLKNITLQKVEVGSKTTINNLFFDFNQSIPEQESVLDLDRVATLMNNMSSLEIEIAGHTDNAGFQDNKKLSEQKAKSVMNYLIRKGCDKNRLKYKGYGSSEPITTNDTEEGRKTNNRIELKVLKVDLLAEQIADEKRIKEPVANFSPDNTITPADEEQAQENKDTAVTADIKDENFNAVNEQPKEDKDTATASILKDINTSSTNEEKVQEEKETITDAVKKDESSDSANEEKVQENKETIVAEVKKDESSDVANEEKVQENKKPIAAEVKKDENVEAANEEKVQENKETIVAETKKDESTDAAAEEKVQENKETIVDAVKKDESVDATAEDKVQENKETIVAEAKKDESTDAVNEEKVPENKETIVTETKKDESTVAASEEKVPENKKSIVAEVKKDESNDAATEEKIQENKENILAEVDKKIQENNEAILAAVEKKLKENKETIAAESKKEENIVASDEEKSQENKDTIIIAGKKYISISAINEEGHQENKETITTPIKKEISHDADNEEKSQETTVSDVNTDESIEATDEEKPKETNVAAANNIENIETADEEKTQENQETTTSKVKKDESSAATDEEENQENKKTITATGKKGENFPRYMVEGFLTEKKDDNSNSTDKKNVQENKENNAVITKKDENIDAANEEKLQEKEETIVTTDKKEENVEVANEETQEKEETIVTTDKKAENVEVANEEKTQEKEETIVASDKKAENVEVANEEKTQEKEETIVATDKKEENVEVANEEKTQEKEETIVVADKKDENSETTNEEKTQENKETIVATDKKEENVVVANEEKTLEKEETIVATDKKEENVEVANEEKTLEKEETIVASDKKEENVEVANEEKTQEKEETIVVASKKDESSDEEVSSTKEKLITEPKENNNKSLLPDNYKKFDKDQNGVISYDEIIKLIDSFFDDDPNVKGDDITALIDHFFGD